MWRRQCAFYEDCLAQLHDGEDRDKAQAKESTASKVMWNKEKAEALKQVRRRQADTHTLRASSWTRLPSGRTLSR